MRTLHFIYAGNPFNDASIHTTEAKTNHVYRRFEHDFNIKYYEWTYKGDFEVCPDDIVLGHPHWDKDTIIQRIFRETHPAAKYLFFPFHAALPDINYPFNDLVMACDKYFAICGKHWYNTIGETIFAPWKEKMIQLDNALDCSVFPYTRTKFHPAGERVLFYIGRQGIEKGTKELADLVRAYGHKLYLAGHFLRDKPLFNGLDVEFLDIIDLRTKYQWVVDVCDIFVNMSISDANPSTILEMASIGLPVLATPQSGYINEKLIHYLSLTDMHHNIKLLNDFQYADESCLIRMAKSAREEVEKNYTWDKFLKPIEEELEKWKQQ